LKMKFKFPFRGKTLGAMLINLSVVIGLTVILAVGYFYIYLPAITNHGESITVPNIQGMKIEEVKEFLGAHDLRYAVGDSSYSEQYPPLSVLQQFPKAGSNVKEGRVIYLSINRVTPPTLPVPDVTKDFSLTGADLIFKSNELKRGKVFYKSSPFLNNVMEMMYQGKIILPGTRVPKGTVIDLVVGDGNGAVRFTLGTLLGDTYERALFKLEGWNLHLGHVEIPEGIDTTGIVPVVFKQSPTAGDSVRVGDPVDIWIAPKGYKIPQNDIDEND
jgi:beta-lactam-binding protein with PASTA domain